MLRYLLPEDAVRPIMGARRLGERSIQESWDLDIARHTSGRSSSSATRASPSSRCSSSGCAARSGSRRPPRPSRSGRRGRHVFLGSRRFADELGARAVELLAAERTVDDAPEVLRRIRRLLAHYRATEPALPAWCEAFVDPGYAHYCTLLPTAFVDEDTGVRQVAAMLGFLFSMESLALSLGCDRAQLELAVRSRTPRRRRRSRCCGPPRTSSACSRWPSCASAATSCSPTRWWCPRSRST